MDFPEPLSSMLREFDINTYLASQQPISFDKVDKEKPYIVCKPISIFIRTKSNWFYLISLSGFFKTNNTT